MFPEGARHIPTLDSAHIILRGATADSERAPLGQGRRHRFRTAGAACPDKGPMAERPKVTYTQNPKTPRIWPIIFQEGPKLCKKMHIPAIFFKGPAGNWGATAPPAPLWRRPCTGVYVKYAIHYHLLLRQRFVWVVGIGSAKARLICSVVRCTAPDG